MPRSVRECRHAFNVSARCRWYCTHAGWHECALEVAALIDKPDRIRQENMLKNAERRLVFRHINPASGERVVVKAFPLKGVKRQLLKHPKYAEAEANHLKLADARGVPVPILHAWGSRGLFFKQWTAVIIEEVNGTEFLTALNTAATPQEQQAILHRSVRLFEHLFKAGVNHIDLKPDALLFGRDSTQDRIIDFQYCTFATPSLATAMAQAGHFAYWWQQQDPAADTMIQDWAESLIRELCPDETEQQQAQALFNRHKVAVATIAQRLQQ